MTGREYIPNAQRWMDATERAEWDRLLEDQSVKFVGGGKGRKLHLIEGASKAQSQPNAVCGQWVSNKRREATAREIAEKELCQRCLRGQSTSFTRWNQPRPCASCGRTFADTASRDNSDALCAECYEEAGLLNAHADGYHALDQDGPHEDCPECQETPAPSEMASEPSSPVSSQVATPAASERPSDALVQRGLAVLIATYLRENGYDEASARNSTVTFRTEDGRRAIVAVAVLDD